MRLKLFLIITGLFLILYFLFGEKLGIRTNTEPSQKCLCHLERVDQLMETKDINSNINVDSIQGALKGKLDLGKLLKGLNIDGGIEGIKSHSKELSKNYIGRSDLSEYPIMEELIITRSVFCSSINYFCQQKKPEEVQKLTEEYRLYTIGLLQQGKTKTSESSPLPKYKLKIIHGDNLMSIKINNKQLPELLDDQSSSYKVYELPKGIHNIDIEYLDNSRKEKSIKLEKHETINHRTF